MATAHGNQFSEIVAIASDFTDKLQNMNNCANYFHPEPSKICYGILKVMIALLSFYCIPVKQSFKLLKLL